MFEFSTSVWIIIAALILDYLLGEVRRYHPLVGFRRIASAIEQWLNNTQLQQTNSDHFVAASPLRQRFLGVVGVSLLILPAFFISYAAQYVLPQSGFVSVIIGATVVYFSLGLRSLVDNAKAVSEPLLHHNIKQARFALSTIVNRDVDACNEREIASGTIESVLKNGNDAVYGCLFWFLVFGLPGVVLYRLINTLEAMWGYKNDRFVYFGGCATRLNDALNYIPALLCGLGYALCGQARQGLRCWRQQAARYTRANGCVVIAAGAGAIGVVVGGGGVYFGDRLNCIELGEGRPVLAADIDASTDLLIRTIASSVLFLILLAAF